MKKRLRVFAVVLCLMMCAAVMAGCGKLSEEEESAVGKYELTSISGLPNVTVGTYEYNYIIFKADKKYELRNKVGSETSEQDGRWSLKDGVLTIRVGTGLFPVTEKHELKDGVMTMAGDMVISGTTYSVTLVYSKTADEV